MSSPTSDSSPCASCRASEVVASSPRTRSSRYRVRVFWRTVSLRRCSSTCAVSSCPMAAVTCSSSTDARRAARRASSRARATSPSRLTSCSGRIAAAPAPAVGVCRARASCSSSEASFETYSPCTRCVTSSSVRTASCRASRSEKRAYARSNSATYGPNRSITRVPKNRRGSYSATIDDSTPSVRMPRSDSSPSSPRPSFSPSSRAYCSDRSPRSANSPPASITLRTSGGRWS